MQECVQVLLPCVQEKRQADGREINKVIMANIYIKLDPRTVHKDGTSPLRMALTHNHVSAYETLNVSIRASEWNHLAQAVVNRPDKKFLNVELRKRLEDAEECLDRISQRDDFKTLSAGEILRMCMRGSATVDTPRELDYVLPVFNERIETIIKAKTRSIYKTVRNNIIEYVGQGIDTLQFKEIDSAWLIRYYNWLMNEKHMSINGAGSYLRTFRALFNYSRQNRFTLADVPMNNISLSELAMMLSNTTPFEGLQTSSIESSRNDMPFDDFIKWVNYPAEEWCVKYRDIFILAFYLCGIRTVDLLELTWDNVQDGRLVYFPKKLNGKTKMSVKIEPEAWEIINRYKGKEHLLEFLDDRADYGQFCKQWNRALKSIGEKVPVESTEGAVKMKLVSPVPYITTRYARYNWGTYCYKLLDIPIDVISQGYGHKNGLRVTNLYVKRGLERVDEANRQLIDYFKKAVEEDRKKNPHDLLRQ